MYCSKCGNKLGSADKFCNNCGTEVISKDLSNKDKVKSHDKGYSLSFSNLFSGRLERLDFFLGGIIATIAFFFPLILIDEVSLTSSDISELLSLVLLGIYIVFALSLSVRRLHDMGYSATWIILAFIIPFFSLYMCVADSNDVDNPYGNKLEGVSFFNKLFGIYPN